MGNETDKNPGRCSRCATAIGSDAPEGLCPRCLIALNLATQTEIAGDDGGAAAKAPPQPPVAPGELARHFPQLEILECLGRGGMGVVYKARHLRLDRLVALKILAPEKEREERFAERFEREARALARLSHANIVTVYDFGRVDGMFYLMMEFVDGASLRQLLRSRRIAPGEALAIVPKICDALQYAHEQGVVHRDIKPENVLLDKQGRVKIADFGIAKILGQPAQTGLTQEQQVIGTPHYMAPEQIEKPMEVDHRADIYSLGVVFYEMLTGELPLGKFAPPSNKVRIDVRLDEVVLHALEKEPARRYQHADEVKTAVETIAETPAKSGTGSSKPEVAVVAPAMVAIARWTARVFSAVLLLFYGVFIVAEGLPPIASQPEGVQLNFIALALMLVGFIAGWKREGAAALLIASGWMLWHVSEGRMRWNLFQTPLPVAVLYAFCWWATHGRRTRVLAGATAVLVVALVSGRLFVPTSVMVAGSIVDARTGQPVTNAELRLLPRPERSLEKGDPPNARADANGRFRLYVGWYVDGKSLAISAPGFVTTTTNLGPRALGQRQVGRDYRLAAGPEASTESPPADRAEWMRRVENFFQHNFRDVTSRESLEWGDVTRAKDGNVSIRYRYRARIWDKQTVTNDQIFTFEPGGKFISAKDAVPKTGAAETPQ